MGDIRGQIKPGGVSKQGARKKRKKRREGGCICRRKRVAGGERRKRGAVRTEREETLGSAVQGSSRCYLVRENLYDSCGAFRRKKGGPEGSLKASGGG